MFKDVLVLTALARSMLGGVSRRVSLQLTHMLLGGGQREARVPRRRRVAEYATKRGRVRSVRTREDRDQRCRQRSGGEFEV